MLLQDTVPGPQAHWTHIESHLISTQLELLTEVTLNLFIRAGSDSLLV